MSDPSKMWSRIAFAVALLTLCFGRAGAVAVSSNGLGQVLLFPYPVFKCAVTRRCFSAGANPARQLSLRPVATGAIVEVTKQLKPLV